MGPLASAMLFPYIRRSYTQKKQVLGSSTSCLPASCSTWPTSALSPSMRALTTQSTKFHITRNSSLRTRSTLLLSAAGLFPTTSSVLIQGSVRLTVQIFNLTANYNALQARVTRRFSKGLEFGVAYTYSKAMDYGSCSGSTCSESYNFTAALYQNLRAWNYGPAGYDIKHNLVVNYLWSLPRASRVWNNVVTRGGTG